MSLGSNDTIYALSSGALPSGVAVIRISGREAKASLRALCGRVPQPRKVALVDVKDSAGEVLDRGVALYFEAPASFTGEDVVELQLHGGKAVVAAVLSALEQRNGLRPATAGEFTRRAFENGKLDLVEVEGLGDLISAETDMQRKLARYLAEGHLSDLYKRWMETLSRCRALIEAELDFADEGDVPGSVSDRVWAEISSLHGEMGKLLVNRTAVIIRDGFRVAIVGKPNVGKSSLLNYLAQRDVAIVTEVAGTTRDVLTVDLDMGGYKVSLYDTAGIRDTGDAVEKIGIERAREAVRDADLVLFLFEAGGDFELLESELEAVDVPILKIRTKSDISQAKMDAEASIEISTKTGQGIDSLVKRIQFTADAAANGGAFDMAALSRHRNHIGVALKNLAESLEAVGQPLEIRAENLRIAAYELGKITGDVSADELLGLIFSEFCIGK